MGGIARKIKRNELKRQLGNNKIKELFHSQNDTIEKRLRDGIRRAKEQK